MPVMNYRKGTEKEKSWIIEETSFNEKYTGKCESVFTQGNGYLGLRAIRWKKDMWILSGVCSSQEHSTKQAKRKQLNFRMFLIL